MNPSTPMVPIHGLHHFAYRCRDAEETRHFYEDLLGLPLTHIVWPTPSRARASTAPMCTCFSR